MSTTFARCRFRRPRLARFVHEACALDTEDLTRPQSHEPHAIGGNGLRRKKQDASFFGRVVWPRLTPSEQVVVTFTRRTHGWTSFHLLPRVTPVFGSMPRFSGFFSCGASGAHFLCPVQVAGVAVHSTRVAITVQLVTWLGFWVTEGSPWRVQPLGCAARLELESP